MTPVQLEIGGQPARPRAKPRKAALEALEKLLRAHRALSEQRSPESPYALLRPARAEELDTIEAVFAHCGVPLPESLRAIYARTLGVGNPVSPIPVLSVPFLRAMLPDEGFGAPLVGLAAFEGQLGLHRDEATAERPPFLFLGHSGLSGLTVSRNGLWSLADYRAAVPQPEDFGLVFEEAFASFVEQVLLLWANDLAGDLLRQRDLDLSRGARLEDMPAALHAAGEALLAPRPIAAKAWGEVDPFDSPDLLRATPRGDASAPHVTVVGLPYCGHPEAADRIGPGDLLRLRPVEDNAHDPQAVEVWRDGEAPVRIGFVARAEAPRCRDLPGGAEAWRLRVTGRTASVLAARIEAAPVASEMGPRASEAVDLFSQQVSPWNCR
jgi:hypothetical protein